MVLRLELVVEEPVSRAVLRQGVDKRVVVSLEPLFEKERKKDSAGGTVAARRMENDIHNTRTRMSVLYRSKYMRPRDVARSTGLRRSAAASSCPPSLHGHASHKNHAEIPLGPGRLMCGVAAVRSFAVCRLHVRPLRRTDLL